MKTTKKQLESFIKYFGNNKVSASNNDQDLTIGQKYENLLAIFDSMNSATSLDEFETQYVPLKKQLQHIRPLSKNEQKSIDIEGNLKEYIEFFELEKKKEIYEKMLLNVDEAFNGDNIGKTEEYVLSHLIKETKDELQVLSGNEYNTRLKEEYIKKVNEAISSCDKQLSSQQDKFYDFDYMVNVKAREETYPNSNYSKDLTYSSYETYSSSLVNGELANFFNGITTKAELSVIFDNMGLENLFNERVDWLAAAFYIASAYTDLGVEELLKLPNEEKKKIGQLIVDELKGLDNRGKTLEEEEALMARFGQLYHQGIKNVFEKDSFGELYHHNNQTRVSIDEQRRVAFLASVLTSDTNINPKVIASEGRNGFYSAFTKDEYLNTQVNIFVGGILLASQRAFMLNPEEEIQAEFTKVSEKLINQMNTERFESDPEYKEIKEIYDNDKALYENEEKELRAEFKKNTDEVLATLSSKDELKSNPKYIELDAKFFKDLSVINKKVQNVEDKFRDAKLERGLPNKCYMSEAEVNQVKDNMLHGEEYEKIKSRAYEKMLAGRVYVSNEHIKPLLNFDHKKLSEINKAEKDKTNYYHSILFCTSQFKNEHENEFELGEAQAIYEGKKSFNKDKFDSFVYEIVDTNIMRDENGSILYNTKEDTYSMAMNELKNFPNEIPMYIKAALKGAKEELTARHNDDKLRKSYEENVKDNINIKKYLETTKTKDQPYNEQKEFVINKYDSFIYDVFKNPSLLDSLNRQLQIFEKRGFLELYRNNEANNLIEKANTLIETLDDTSNLEDLLKVDKYADKILQQLNDLKDACNEYEEAKVAQNRSFESSKRINRLNASREMVSLIDLASDKMKNKNDMTMRNFEGFSRDYNAIGDYKNQISKMTAEEKKTEKRKEISSKVELDVADVVNANNVDMDISTSVQKNKDLTK